MRTYRQMASSSLDLPPDNYVYQFLSFAEDHSSPTRLAVISSDDSLRIFDATTLKLLNPGGVLPAVGKGITSAVAYGLPGQEKVTVFAAGRDGAIYGWDCRTHDKALELHSPKGQPLSALACCGPLHAVVAGTELEGNAPGETNIFGWDVRMPGQIMLKYSESHTNTVTELQFAQPASGLPNNHLLSASTDGLVTIFDTGVAEEDDAVFQVINHRSAVHHTGFLGASIYALGTDETLSFYAKQDSPMPPKDVHHGDVREEFQCDYIVDIVQSAEATFVASGRHGEEPAQQYLDLIKLQAPSETAQVDWRFDFDDRIRLFGGHGSEVIRDAVVIANLNVVFTCGEDGAVRGWRESSPDDMDQVDTAARKRRPSHGGQRKDKRSKAYHQ